jgi:hypothetical protein
MGDEDVLGKVVRITIGGVMKFEVSAGYKYLQFTKRVSIQNEENITRPSQGLIVSDAYVRTDWGSGTWVWKVSVASKRGGILNEEDATVVAHISASNGLASLESASQEEIEDFFLSNDFFVRHMPAGKDLDVVEIMKANVELKRLRIAAVEMNEPASLLNGKGRQKTL